MNDDHAKTAEEAMRPALNVCIAFIIIVSNAIGNLEIIHGLTHARILSS